MKRWFKIGFLVFVGFILVVTGLLIWMMQGQEEILNYEIGEIDLSEVSDGVYVGSFDQGRWKNQVEVTVENHEIIDIKVIKTVRFERKEITQEVILQVINQQSLDVDIEAGTTITVNAYLISIRKALD